MFYSRRASDLIAIAYEGRDDFDASVARAVELDGRSYLVAQRVLVIDTLLRGTDLDPDTFQALGHGYARDASHVVWSGPDHPLRQIAGADLATFEVDASGARDRHGRFVAGARVPGSLPVETETEPARAAERLIQDLWRGSLASWFADFDISIVTDDGVVRVGKTGEVVTPIPDHQLVIDGARLTLEAGGHRCEGTVSALELLAGFLYGLARGKVIDQQVCVRVALGTDGKIVSNAGTPSRSAYQVLRRRKSRMIMQRPRRVASTIFQGTLRARRFGTQPAPSAGARSADGSTTDTTCYSWDDTRCGWPGPWAAAHTTSPDTPSRSTSTTRPSSYHECSPSAKNPTRFNDRSESPTEGSFPRPSIAWCCLT
jgi:hypothetical protein